MVVPEADPGAGAGGGGLDGAELGGVQRAGFLDEHVLARLHRGEGEGRQRRVERGDDAGVDRRIGERPGEIGQGRAVRGRLRQGGRAARVEITGVAQLARRQGGGALAADEAATGDGELGRDGHQDVNFLSRSSGTMRRRV